MKTFPAYEIEYGPFVSNERWFVEWVLDTVAEVFDFGQPFIAQAIIDIFLERHGPPEPDRMGKVDWFAEAVEDVLDNTANSDYLYSDRVEWDGEVHYFYEWVPLTDVPVEAAPPT